MKHILFVLPNLRGGGAEKLTINLANYFVYKNYKVTIIILNKKNDYETIINKKVSVICLNSFRFIFSIPTLTNYFYKLKPDFILASMWPLTSISIISWYLSGRKGRLYVSEHNMLSISSIRELKIWSFKLWLSISLTYNFCDGVIAVSNGVKEDLKKISFLNKKKIIVIHNPITFTYNNNDDNSNIYKWNNLGSKILSVGSLIEQKDHKTLINAFNIISKKINAELVIIGEGHLFKKLTNQINKLKLSNKIKILPFTTNLKKFYKEADLFVLSSKWEGFGNVIVEALEQGTPVVSTDCQSGPSEILTSKKYGELVPINNKNNLANAILRSLNKKYNKNILIERSKDFSVEKMGNLYLRTLNG